MDYLAASWRDTSPLHLQLKDIAALVNSLATIVGLAGFKQHGLVAHAATEIPSACGSWTGPNVGHGANPPGKELVLPTLRVPQDVS
jgi:hypothetical protein